MRQCGVAVGWCIPVVAGDGGFAEVIPHRGCALMVRNSGSRYVGRVPVVRLFEPRRREPRAARFVAQIVPDPAQRATYCRPVERWMTNVGVVG